MIVEKNAAEADEQRAAHQQTYACNTGWFRELYLPKQVSQYAAKNKGGYRVAAGETIIG